MTRDRRSQCDWVQDSASIDLSDTDALLHGLHNKMEDVYNRILTPVRDLGVQHAATLLAEEQRSSEVALDYSLDYVQSRCPLLLPPTAAATNCCCYSLPLLSFTCSILPRSVLCTLLSGLIDLPNCSRLIDFPRHAPFWLTA